MSSRISLLHAAAVAVLLIVSGCGGGGGSADNAGAGGGDGAAVTGLIPTAPAAGATLHADAAVLQPLRPGAVWHYRGSVANGSGGGPFGVLVRHTAGSAGAVVEQRQSSAVDDDGTVTYTSAGGTITATESLDLATGATGATSANYSYPLLRSPIRQAEQITLLDQLAVATGVDIDGDRINDSADVAAFSRVIGTETVDLPDLQKAIAALRIDTTFLVRFKQSSNGQIRPVLSLLQSNWYAPGIGVVRSASTGASETPAGTNYETNEHLVYWDGVVEGIGALPPVGLRAPGSGAALNRPWSAVRVGDRVLVATTVAAGLAANVRNGFVLSALGANGTVLSSQSYPGLALHDPPMPLLPLAGGVALVNSEVRVGPGSTISFEVRLRRFDSNGAVVGSAAGVALVSDLPDTPIAAASDGTKVWLMWVSRSVTSTSGSQVWLRDFDNNGQPLGAARLLESPRYFGGRLALGAMPGRVLASWASDDTEFSGNNIKYALVLGGAVAQPRSLGSAWGPNYSGVKPVLSDTRQSLAWPGLLGFGGYTNSDDLLMRAIALADDGAPIRSPAATLDAEVLAARPGAVVNGIGSSTSASVLFNAFAFADGNSFKVAVAGNEVMLPGLESFSSNHLQLREWSTAAALASTAPTLQLRRLEWSGFTPTTSFGALQFVVPLDDRLLAFGYDSRSGLAAATVYRR